MLNDLSKTLLTEEQIKTRVKELAGEISEHYGDEEVTVISIINGAILFTADLVRNMPGPVRIDCIRVSSYENSTTPVGRTADHQHLVARSRWPARSSGG